MWRSGRARWRPRAGLAGAAGLIVASLIGFGLPTVGAGASESAAGDLYSTVDLGRVVQRTDPFAIGFGSSTYGSTPLSSTGQSSAEQRLDARSVRLPVGFRNGRVTSSAAGTSGTLDMPALVQHYRDWGYRVLVVIGGRTTDTDVQPGDATRIIRALGVGPNLDYSAPNEPNNRGQTVQEQLTTARMITREGKALDPEFRLWGPVWTHFDRTAIRTFASGMGADLGGIDYHHYAMGSDSMTTAEAMRDTPRWGQEIRDVRTDLAAMGSSAQVNVDELNFSWRYQDGTPGGNNRFFTAVNTVWMTSVLGHILEAGGRGMPYASQNGPLGMTVEAGGVNPDGRAPSSPMPAYWGIASWTGATLWPHYKDTLYDATSSDPNSELFAVNNEAGGYNIIAINKSESDDKRLNLNLRNVASGTYTAYQTDPAAPYDQPAQVQRGDYSTAAPETMTLPRMSVTVIVVKPGAAPLSPAPAPPAPVPPAPAPVSPTVPAAPGSLVATSSADRTEVGLTWPSPPSDGGSAITGFRVTRDGADTTGGGAFTTVLPASARTFRFTLLDPRAAYNFRVHTINAVGTGPGVTAAVHPPTRPSAPTAVRAAPDETGNRASVSWQVPASDGSSTITGYVVSSTGVNGAGQYTTATRLPASHRSTQVALPGGATTGYTIGVQAINAAGVGETTTVVTP